MFEQPEQDDSMRRTRSSSYQILHRRKRIEKWSEISRFCILVWCLLPFKDVIFSDFSIFDVYIFALFFKSVFDKFHLSKFKSC